MTGEPGPLRHVHSIHRMYKDQRVGNGPRKLYAGSITCGRVATPDGPNCCGGETCLPCCSAGARRQTLVGQQRECHHVIERARIPGSDHVIEGVVEIVDYH
jgi:hypothetical protein